MHRPTLYLTVGLPASGKTTHAREIEGLESAMRLTKDEWMKALYGDGNPSSASDVIEGRLISIGLRALELGINVVIDFGLWSRDERSALRHAAAERGAAVVVLYFPISASEQKERAEKRLAASGHETWPMSDAELAEWASRFEVPTAGELDGTEPVGNPPSGFATWSEWTRHRWPDRLGP